MTAARPATRESTRSVTTRTPAASRCPRYFASHPFLTTGATATDIKGRVVTAGLYLDGNGPHPINSFGCTICHGGQGSGYRFHFRFAYASERQGRRAVEREVRLAGDPSLGLPHAAASIHRVELREMPPSDHRYPPGQEASGRLPADRAVRLHGLSHDRRRRIVRAGPDR